MPPIRVKDFMSKMVVAVLPDTQVRTAEQKLIDQNLDAIYITDEDRNLLGIVPDYVLLKRRRQITTDQASIASMMLPVSTRLDLYDTIDQAIILLREHIHRSAPVLSGNQLAGYVCRNSVMKILHSCVSLNNLTEESTATSPHPIPPAPKLQQFCETGKENRVVPAEFRIS